MKWFLRALERSWKTVNLRCDSLLWLRRIQASRPRHDVIACELVPPPLVLSGEIGAWLLWERLGLLGDWSKAI
jgi:hypothetical protein